MRRQRAEPALALVFVAFVAFACLSVGCASTDTPRRFIDRLRTPNEGVRAGLAELEERVGRLETEASEKDGENARLRERIDELARAVNDVRAAAVAAARRPPPAPFEPEPPPRQRVVEVSDIDGAAGQAPVGALPDTVAADEAPASGDTNAAPARPAAATGRELYDQALEAFMNEDYTEAELGFRRYMGAFADTDLSDNALYWIGECRFARGDTRGALAAFQQMLHDFPLGNKVPDALLKVGRSLERLGDTEGARRRFREVTRRFPDSEAARMAAVALSGRDDP